MEASRKSELIIAGVGVLVSIAGIILYRRSQQAASQQAADLAAQQNEELASLLSQSSGAYGTPSASVGGSGGSSGPSLDPTAGGLLGGASPSTPPPADSVQGSGGGSPNVALGSTVVSNPQNLSPSALASSLAVQATLTAGDTFTFVDANGNFVTLHPDGSTSTVNNNSAATSPTATPPNEAVHHVPVTSNAPGSPLTPSTPSGPVAKPISAGPQGGGVFNSVVSGLIGSGGSPKPSGPVATLPVKKPVAPAGVKH